MNRIFTAALAGAMTMTAGAAIAENVKFGFLGGFTGPIETLTPPIFEGAQLAIADVNAGGGLSAGLIQTITGDTGCIDTNAAISSADRLVNSEGVVGIIGALCSGSTIAAANSAAVPGGVVMISPASTSPAVSALEDMDHVFRTVPSDAYQGEVLAGLLLSKDITSVAVTYVNNDYGKGFNDAFVAAYEASGGEVAISAAHEDGKADYRAEVGLLESAGADALVVLAYADGSGQVILRQAVESGLFETFVGGDGMVGDALVAAVGADALEGMIATRPGSPEAAGKTAFEEAALAAGLDPNGVFVAQGYDAAFLMALAAEHAGGDMAAMPESLRAVASAPGEVILPGEWEKARELIANGVDINYEGASGPQDFDANGDVPGVIVEMTVTNGSFVEVGFVE